MRFLIALAAGLLFMLPQARPCLNEYRQTALPLHNGVLQLNLLLDPETKASLPYWHYGFEKIPGLAIRRDSLKRVFKNLDYKGVSDLAVLELKIGDRRYALELLDSLCQKHPGEYTLLANLGTACELTGNLPRALALLKTAIRLQPAAHFNSEWIHVKLLEQAVLANPDYRQVIALGTTPFESWWNNRADPLPAPADSLKKQLAYQLHERIAFTPPPNEAVAQLLLDFADIVARHDGSPQAMPFYEFAASYGNAEMVNQVTARKALLQKTSGEIKATFRWAAGAWALPLVFFILVFIAWLRSIRKKRDQTG